MVKLPSTDHHAAKQPINFAGLVYASRKGQPWHEKSFAELEQRVRSAGFEALVEPVYAKVGCLGRRPIEVAGTLHYHLLQQWSGLADVTLENAMYSG